MKKKTISFRSVVLGLSLLMTAAFASYQDTVYTWSGGSNYSSGTAYSVPVGATVEGYAYAYTGYAGYSVSGGGFNEYEYTSNGQVDFADYTTGGDISYTIWAYASWPNYAFSTFVASW